MVEGHLDWHAPADDPLVEGAEVRQRMDLEGDVLVAGVVEEGQINRHLGRVAAEEDVLAEVGRVRRDRVKERARPGRTRRARPGPAR